MDRRHFLALVTALAAAPGLKAEAVTRKAGAHVVKVSHYPNFHSAIDVDLNLLRKLTFGGVAINARVPSFINGGIVPSPYKF
jgi:hypothetical protein